MFFYLAKWTRQQRRLQKTLQQLPTQKFRESEMRRCKCCTPSKKTLITLDPEGWEQFTCPATRHTMRWSIGAQTYLKGSIILPGRF